MGGTDWKWFSCGHASSTSEMLTVRMFIYISLQSLAILMAPQMVKDLNEVANNFKKASHCIFFIVVMLDWCNLVVFAVIVYLFIYFLLVFLLFFNYLLLATTAIPSRKRQ